MNLTQVLSLMGCTHRKGQDQQRRDIYRLDGSKVGSFTAHEAWDALRDRPEIILRLNANCC